MLPASPQVDSSRMAHHAGAKGLGGFLLVGNRQETGSGWVVLVVRKSKEILVRQQQGVLAPLEEVAYTLHPLRSARSQRGVSAPEANAHQEPRMR